MKIKEITVSLGRTINLGNYESARVEVTIKASSEEIDHKDIDALYDIVKTELKDRVKKGDY